MVNTQVNLQTGMTRRQVLREAKQAGLDKESRKQIKLFFKNDNDKMITNGNELAVLNKLFGKTEQVEMPKENTKDGASVYTNKEGKKKTFDTLIDSNDDGYADARNIQTDKKRKGGVTDIRVDVDRDLDGVPDKGQGLIARAYTQTKPDKFGEALEKNHRMYASGAAGVSSVRENSSAPSNKAMFGGGLGIEYRNEKNHFQFEGIGGTTNRAKIEYGYNFNLAQINDDVKVGLEPCAVASASYTKKDEVQNQYLGTGALLNLRKKNSSGTINVGLGVETGKNFCKWTTEEARANSN